MVPCERSVNVAEELIIPDSFDAPDGGSVVVPLLVEYHTVYVTPDSDIAIHETVKDGDPSNVPLLTLTPLTCKDSIQYE